MTTECPKVRRKADSAEREQSIFTPYRIGSGAGLGATEFLQSLAVVLGLRTLTNSATSELSNAILPA